VFLWVDYEEFVVFYFVWIFVFVDVLIIYFGIGMVYLFEVMVWVGGDVIGFDWCVVFDEGW